MVTLVLLAASWVGAAAPHAPSAVVRIEAELSASETARRLLLADGGVPRREVHDAGRSGAVEARGGARPEVVIDVVKVPRLSEPEVLAQYALALSRAAVASPVVLVEAEQASWQWTAQVLVELAAADAELSRLLARAQKTLQPGMPVFSRAAAYLTLFEQDPKAFYWAVESSAREAVRLTDLEDLFALRRREIAALGRPPSGVYGELAGRRYPGALVRAAYQLRAGGELVRLREALGAYDSVGIPPLRVALTRWRRAVPSTDGSHFVK